MTILDVFKRFNKFREGNAPNWKKVKGNQFREANTNI